ncbi:polycystin-2 [Folsomia candida]|uniref:polycystin-2 n=1 Tax=Folsomia candida TaxID=158441 RepID=UPI00160552C2|nr:polycystin-2 [Folsomia candida]
MIVGIVTSLSVSVKKYYVMENITETIQLMKVNEYVNLQEIAYWDGVQSAAFSITQCICFLKIWRLLVFLEGGFLVTSLTVRLASHMIFAFSFVVLIVLVGFTCAGYIFFGGSMAQFSTLGNTFLTLIGQSLHVTIFDELYLTNRIIGPIYGSVYGFVSNILFLNLLIAILNQSMIEAKMLANEKFRNWGIAESIVHHIFRRHGHQPATSALVELQPDRLEGLKKSTAELFRAALRSEDAQKMKKIKLYAKYLLEGTDYYLLRRQPANYYQEFLKERKMDEMRLQTAEFLKARMGTEMSVEEMRKYNDINKTIVSLRIFKLEKAVNELQRKLKRYRNDEVVFQCRSENGVITFV